MDDPTLDPREHVRALRGLERINALSRPVDAIWPALCRFARLKASRPLRVLDVACGAGDLLAALARRARRRGVALELAGCDISPTALAYARSRTPTCELFLHDVIGHDLPAGYDVICSSLFLHHLSDAQARTLLTRMSHAATLGIIVNDLLRHVWGWRLAWVVTRLVSRSPVVHQDGPQSVAAAFTLDEVRALAHSAGLTNVQLVRCWPFRFLLTWYRSHEESA
jgi:SAM-dependent methyltransferase